MMMDVSLDRLDFGPNVRDHADTGLQDTVARHGVVSPITVADTQDGRFRVVVGHRRATAARAAGLQSVPAVVIGEPERPAIIQLVENVHRADLEPMERANAIRRLVDEGMSQADVARELGLSPATIANDLRLLRAEPEVREAIATGRLTRAHGKAIANLPPVEQRSLVKRASNGQMSSRDLERYATERKARVRSVSMPLGQGCVTVGVDGDTGRIDLVIEDGHGRGVMLDVTPDQARSLAKRLAQAAAAASA